MADYKHKPSPGFGRSENNYYGSYEHGRSYGREHNNDSGIDARAYGNYRNGRGSRNEEMDRRNEYDSDNEGYNGRNASDFQSHRYSDSYYYNPGDHRYNYTDNYRGYEDADYNRNYNKDNQRGP